MITQLWRTPANAVTFLRVALTPVIVVAILNGHHRAAAVCFAIAAWTDFFDGLLARKQATASAVGQYFDPIADKLLLSGVFIALAIQGSIPMWFLALVLGRDLAIVIASAIAMRVSTYSDYTPTLWGKISTVLQLFAAVTVMAANAEGSGAWVRVAHFFIAAAALGTVWSTIHYTWRGVSYFVRSPHNQHT